MNNRKESTIGKTLNYGERLLMQMEINRSQDHEARVKAFHDDTPRVIVIRKDKERMQYEPEQTVMSSEGRVVVSYTKNDGRVIVRRDR